MKHSDVLILGAGPSGCSAAYDLAATGLSVTLLDKKEAPAGKPCAGGLTIKTINALRFPVADIVRRTCCNCVVGLKNDRSKTLPSRLPIAVMVERAEFDAYHLNKCRETGAEFSAIAGPIEINRTREGWILRAGDEAFSAKHLVGADGAHSQVRKTFNLFPHITMGFALETKVPVQNTQTFEMEFDFGIVDRGYGWVFPKDDHLNIGLYSLNKIPDAKRRLREYCQQKTGKTAEHPIVGHPIPFNGQAFRHTPNSPLLVGDAAGLVDPLLGEGLYNAIRSGQLAAEAIVRMQAGESDPYGKLIREITSELRAYRLDTWIFYKYLSLGYASLTCPPISYVIMKGYALGKPIGHLKYLGLMQK